MDGLQRNRRGRLTAGIAAALLAALLATGCAGLHGEPDDGAGTSVAKGAGRVGAALLTLGISETWHSNEAAMEAWLGYSAKDLTRAWGSPQEIIPDGKGGRIYLYIEQEITPPDGNLKRVDVVRTSRPLGPDGEDVDRPSGPNASTPGYAREWGVFRQFHVNPAGVIVDYAWEGL